MIGARSLVVAAAAIWIYASEHRSGDLPHAQTLVMATLAVTLLVQMLAALSERLPFLRMTRSLRPTFWLALGGGLAIQLLAVYWTLLRGVLQTVPLSVADWQRIAVVAVVALGAVEVGKAMLPRLKIA
jgi:magnesium-transporting ATPase (P-type)